LSQKAKICCLSAVAGVLSVESSLAVYSVAAIDAFHVFAAAEFPAISDLPAAFQL
jgi:hypothetical protein